MIKQAFLKFVKEAAPDVQRWPRRQPGNLLIGDTFIRYADMHGLFWQAVQIFQQDLYGTDFKTDAPRILDCGAHIGMAAVYFKSVHPKAAVTSFEADPLIADMARYNLKSFGFEDVKIEPKAVWTHNDGVAFDMSGDDSGHVTDGSDADTTPSARLKDYLEAEAVDLVKLDVEGAEFALIEDCRNVLGQSNRWIIEAHHLAGPPPKIGPMIAALEDAGFQVAFQDLNLAGWVDDFENPPFACLPTNRYVMTIYAWQ